MTKNEIIKEIEWHMDASGAMVCIENLGMVVWSECLWAVYGIKRFNGLTYFVCGCSKNNLICPVKWDKFRKDDLRGILNRMKGNIPQMYSRKDGDGYDFYKIWL